MSFPKMILPIVVIGLASFLKTCESFKCYSCEEDPNEGRGNCLIGEAHLEDMVECSEEGVPRPLVPYLVCYSVTFRYKNFPNSYGARYGCLSTFLINRKTSGCDNVETFPLVEPSVFEMIEGQMCVCKGDRCNDHHMDSRNLRSAKEYAKLSTSKGRQTKGSFLSVLIYSALALLLKVCNVD